MIDIVIEVTYQELPGGNILINVDFAVFKLEAVLELLLPDWVVHLLEALVVVLHDVLLIFPVK